MYFDKLLTVKYSHSLVVRLLAIAITLVLSGSAMRYLFIDSTLRSGFTEAVNAQQLSMAKYVADDINGKIIARRELLEHLASEVPHMSLANPMDVQQWLESHTTVRILFSYGVVVIPADGKSAIADFPPLPHRRELDFNDRDWFRIARDQGEFAVGRPGIGRAAKEAVVNMAVPIRDANGKVVGVMMGVTALNSPGFLDLVERGTVGETGGMLLISPRDKLFVTSSNAAMRLQPTPNTGVNPLHDKAMVGWRGTGKTVNAQGVEELAAIADIPSARWFLVVRTPTEETFRSIEKLLGSVLRANIAVGIFLIVFVTWLLRRMFRPLLDSATSMRAMARGEIPLEPLPLRRHDEVGSMVKSFNELVAQQREAQRRMAYLAHHDPLTGLPNRLAFKSHMAHSMALADRQRGALAVLFLDLDGFKLVNDTYGHDMGDLLLQQVSERLLECVRASDIVGRMGGDEFVLLVTDDPDEAAVAHIAEKVIERISEPYAISGHLLSISTSIGVARYPQDATTIDQLLVLADSAMYIAKRGGGRRHQSASQSSNASRY